MKIRAFITQHKAEKISECQDRFSVNKEKRIIAVSDGMSQSIFPDYWAKLLVEHYTAKGQLSDDDKITLCKEWKRLVQEYIADEKNKGKNPWRIESNLEEGISAGATLCGVKFEDDKKWICEVIGDSCLIKVGKDNTIEILSSEEKIFDTYPDYLDSNPSKRGRGSFKTFEGELSSNDMLLLVSDPFSEFFDKMKGESARYIEQLLKVSNHEDFVSLVARWREEGMHNDDSTVVIIEWDGSPDFKVDIIDNLDKLIENESKAMEEQLRTSGVAKERSKNKNTQKEDKGEKNISKPDIDDTLKFYLKEQIGPFVKKFISDKKQLKECTGFKSILKWVFTPKNKKTKQFRKLLETVLNEYVKSLK